MKLKYQTLALFAIVLAAVLYGISLIPNRLMYIEELMVAALIVGCLVLLKSNRYIPER